MADEILFESTWDFQLYRDSAGRLIFDVVCGTVAIYTIAFPLNAEEIAGWEREGERFLKHLSYRVRDYPNEYLARSKSK
ncbi:MAG: hypothetical protein KIH69_013985 [Anaerolineae bacterium]|nr:hypothetical protein [Anaerolineae bacterium]